MGKRRKPLQDLREEERYRLFLERGKPYPWDFIDGSEERVRLGLPSYTDNPNAYEDYWNKKESK